MISEIKLLLGEAADNYSDDLIALCLKMALAEVETYCGIEPDTELEMVAQQIAIIKLNRIGTEGVASQSYSGVNESYVDGYPAEIQMILDRRKVKKIRVM